MTKVTPLSSRKADHIRINLEENVSSGLSSGLENYRFIHQALPEINLEDVNLNVNLLDRKLKAPILISSMTGGTKEAGKINRVLAVAAQEAQIAMGLGSQRAALEQAELSKTFKVRQYAPDIVLLANLGAVQLNYSYGVDECQRAVNMIEADALILHLNPLQEAIQPEGDTRFKGLLKKIEMVCRELSVPVVIKEVGWGISKNVANKLLEAGVTAIDVAGAGGTSWSQVEMHRAKNERQAQIAAAFVDWGIPTAQSLINVRSVAPEVTLIASGGIHSGIDIAKSIALGATVGGLASPFLKAAVVGEQNVLDLIEDITKEIQIGMFAAGVKDIHTLKNTELEFVK